MAPRSVRFAEVKDRWSMIGWVIKIFLSRASPLLEMTDQRCLTSAIPRQGALTAGPSSSCIVCQYRHATRTFTHA
jgi:hypothetical protein